MLLEAASLVAASLIHSGALIAGYEHRQAGIAAGVIATVLSVGLALTWIRLAWMCGMGLATQAFALLGRKVGLFTIVIGIGPPTVPDFSEQARCDADHAPRNIDKTTHLKRDGR